MAPLRPTRAHGADDEGTILVYAAVALVALLSFSALVLDYGVFWTARRQVQNAADSAALAAAMSLAYEDPQMVFDTPRQTAMAVGRANYVWGAAPAVSASDVTFPMNAVGAVADDPNHLFLPIGFDPAKCVETHNSGSPAETPYYFCARVGAYRDGASGHNNPLPTLFASLLGINNQGVRAFATAISLPANRTTCLRPFVIPDRPKTAGEDDYGYRFAVMYGQDTDTSPLLDSYSLTATTPGSYRFLNPGNVALDSAAAVTAAVVGCTSNTYSIGQDITGEISTDPALGVTITAAMPGIVSALTSLDSNAVWDAAAKRIVGSCAASRSCGSDPTAAASPRIIVIPVVDRVLADAGTFKITNFMALFVSELRPTGFLGVMVSRPGQFVPSAEKTPSDISYLRAVQLIR